MAILCPTLMKPDDYSLRASPPPFRRHLTRVWFQLRRPDRFRLLQEQVATEKCIFVHIPKCAGTSVRQSLFGRDGGHPPLENFRTMLPPEIFARSFKFTFARNPWDRLVSAFFFLKKSDLKRNQRFNRRHLSAFNDFDSFVRQWVTRKNIWSFTHFLPQHHFLCIDKRLGVDFVGFYENLAEDFAIIARRIGKHTELREENRLGGRDKDYRQYYNEETRGIVAKVYAEDIALLGYSFDNSSLPDQLAARDKNPRAVAV
jgi:sulfotransferase famil protein